MQTMMPPADGNHPTINVNGRSYTCALGSVISNVPDYDAEIMEVNGWTKAAGAGVGATTARPPVPLKNQNFYDSTLGYIVKYDGKTWRNPITGAAV